MRMIRTVWPRRRCCPSAAVVLGVGEWSGEARRGRRAAAKEARAAGEAVAAAAARIRGVLLMVACQILMVDG